jgi:DNA polymerase-3 subunit delta'
MFSGLTGNDQAKGQLKRLIASGRVPRSLLFAGPEGVGKRLFAFGLAKALMCSSGQDHEGCGKCSICARITEIIAPPAEKGDEYDRVFFGNHTDVGLVVPYKRNLRVGSIRALEREAQFRPYEAPIRLFIINDAEKMNDASANALLKTLEEPADTTYLVLIASRPDSLLPTFVREVRSSGSRRFQRTQ